MKNLFKILLVLIMVLTLVGCGEDKPKPDPTPDDPTPTEKVEVSEIKISNLPTSLEVGEDFDLSSASVVVSPNNATNKEYEWSSSDESIIKIDNGKLIALKTGTVTIKATALDGSGKYSKAQIEVIDSFVPELNVSNQVITRVGLSQDITITTNMSDEIICTVSDSTIAKIEGNVVTGLKEGTCTITVKCGELEQEVEVIIMASIFEIQGDSSVIAGNTLQLKAILNGLESTATWTSNEPNIATIDSNGLVTAISEGSVIIKAKSAYGDEVQLTITVEANTVKPTSITLTSNAPDTIYIDTEIKLDYEVLPAGASRDVTWTTSDERTAKVDKNGNVRFYKGGSVVITCTSKLRKGTTTSITLTSLDYVDPMAFFVKYSVGEVAQQWCENACWDRDPYPWTLVRGSISYYWFEDYVVVTSTAYDASPGEYSYDKRANTWYITVHDAGGVSTGQSLANYAKGSARNESKSWHYSVGSDGIFKGLDEDYGGWHAGDGNRPVEWTDTKVEADPFNPHATVSISSDQYWIVNGVKTDIKVRPTNAGGSGVPTRFTDSDLPMTGINTRIGSNGTYLISNVWWSSSYRTLSNCGGNMNSIGMESEVGDNAELEVTWHHIAQLCADIIVRRNLALGLDAICQHNTFSGKNCPQTMREAGRWGYFKKMAEAEYYARKYLQDFKFELICSSPLIDSRGQVISFPEVATEVTYQVRVTSATYNYDKTTEPIKVIVPAAIPKTK